MSPSRDDVLTALEKVIDPELRRSVVELDMVRDVRVGDGRVSLTIALTVPSPLTPSQRDTAPNATRTTPANRPPTSHTVLFCSSFFISVLL